MTLDKLMELEEKVDSYMACPKPYLYERTIIIKWIEMADDETEETQMKIAEKILKEGLRLGTAEEPMPKIIAVRRLPYDANKMKLDRQGKTIPPGFKVEGQLYITPYIVPYKDP